jgi:glycosyltransferase involved in cell wall biosynthesis
MKPKVVFLSQAPLQVGGVERNILQLTEKLAKRYDFHVVGPIKEDFAQAVSVATTSLPRFSKTSPRAVWRLKKLFERLKADIVHAVEPRARLLGHLAARLTRARTLYTVHMNPLSYPIGKTKRAVYAALEGTFNQLLTDHVIFVSASDRDLYRSLHIVRRNDASVIHNSINPEEFRTYLQRRKQTKREVREALSVSSSAALVCTVGRLTHQKGIDFLIEAACILSEGQTLRDVCFAIAGDGALRTELEKTARRKNVGNSFRFLGFRPRNDVYRLLSASDLFVLPSRFECFPFAILEAMALGLPCVVNEVGGTREMIDDGRNGYLLDTGDVQGLAESIRRLATDEALRNTFSKKAREKVKLFSNDEMAQKTSALYQQLL